jgi:hypothetical protein
MIFIRYYRAILKYASIAGWCHLSGKIKDAKTNRLTSVMAAKDNRQPLLTR